MPLYGTRLTAMDTVLGVSLETIQWKFANANALYEKLSKILCSNHIDHIAAYFGMIMEITDGRRKQKFKIMIENINISLCFLINNSACNRLILNFLIQYMNIAATDNFAKR